MSSPEAPAELVGGAEAAAEPSRASKGERVNVLERLGARLCRLHASAWFLLIAGPTGVFLVFSIPPFQSPDEANHLYRVYTLSEGALVAARHDGRVGGYVPNCLPVYVSFQYSPGRLPEAFDSNRFVQQPSQCRSSATTFVPFENTAVYSPVAYAPQTVAVGLVRRLGAPLPAVFYAGRMAALLAYLGLVYLALRIATRGHSVLFLVGVWPMSVLSASVYSADTMTLALALCLVAFALRCIDDPTSDWRTFAGASAAAVGLALTKEVYVVLAALLVLAPSRLFPDQLTAAAARIGALALAAVASGLWYLQVRAISLAVFYPGGAVDPSLQLRLILADPGRYLKFMTDLLLGERAGYTTWQTFVAQVGFFRDMTRGGPGLPPPWVMVLSYCLLVQAYLRDGARRFVWSWWGVLGGALPLLIVVGGVAVIFTSVFVEAIPVGRPFALAGRYLLPLAPVPVLSLATLQPHAPLQRRLVPLVPFVLLVVAWLVSKVEVEFY